MFCGERIATRDGDEERARENKVSYFSHIFTPSGDKRTEVYGIKIHTETMIRSVSQYPDTR